MLHMTWNWGTTNTSQLDATSHPSEWPKSTTDETAGVGEDGEKGSPRTVAGNAH